MSKESSTASSLSFSSDLVRGVHARAFACVARFSRRSKKKRETARSLKESQPTVEESMFFNAD